VRELLIREQSDITDIFRLIPPPDETIELPNYISNCTYYSLIYNDHEDAITAYQILRPLVRVLKVFVVFEEDSICHRVKKLNKL
jgi:hypothetical protein